MLKSSLVELSWGTVKTKDTYLGAKYKKLVPRLGKKKALLAIGHKILVSVFHMLKKKEKYKELGKDYVKKQNITKKLKYYQKQIEDLGYEAAIIQKANVI